MFRRFWAHLVHFCWNCTFALTTRLDLLLRTYAPSPMVWLRGEVEHIVDLFFNAHLFESFKPANDYNIDRITTIKNSLFDIHKLTKNVCYFVTLCCQFNFSSLILSLFDIIDRITTIKRSLSDMHKLTKK